MSQSPLASAALIPNPRLAPFAPLLAEWATTGRHAMIPGVMLHGRVVFDWHEGGAFLRMRTEVDEPRIPAAVALVGSDDAGESFTMLYFDERTVSRRFEVSIDGDVVRWWRTAPGFSQRFTLTIAPGARTLHGVSEFSKDDVSWQQDLEMAYTRVARST